MVRCLKTFLLAGMTFLLATSLWAQEYPRPAGAINDFAGVLSVETRTRLEGLARELWDKTGTAVVVAIVTTIGDSEVNDYVNRLYQAWGIGRKGEDKGVLIFVTIKERKMRIETGYGVEGILPDGLVGEIRDRYMIPYFRENKFDEGVSRGMEAIATIVAKNAGVKLTGKMPEPPRRIKAREERGKEIVGFILALLTAAFLFGTRTGRRILPWLIVFSMVRDHRGGYSGGGFGGFGGGFGGFGGGMSGGGGASGSF